MTNEPTEGPTTLSAFAWAGECIIQSRTPHRTYLISITESDPNATTIIDVVCVAFNPSPGRFQVHMRRQLRRTAIATLQPYFEPCSTAAGP